jgi:hypothetical protein
MQCSSYHWKEHVGYKMRTTLPGVQELLLIVLVRIFLSLNKAACELASLCDMNIDITTELREEPTEIRSARLGQKEDAIPWDQALRISEVIPTETIL